MTGQKMWQRLNAVLREEMLLNDEIVLFGQDVATAGGTFGVTRRLVTEFGRARVFDTPIAEQGTLGMAAGAAMGGLTPVVEILFGDFLLLGADALVNQMAKIGYFSGGKIHLPVTVRVGVGTGRGMGGQHCQNLEGWFAGVPGLCVVWPSTAATAGSLLRSAIRCPEPVIIFESVSEYARTDELCAEVDVAIGDCVVRREGDDITIVTWGGAVRVADDAASRICELASCEIIDLVSLSPWDVETVLRSVRKTGRCVVLHNAVVDFGPGGEIASVISENCHDILRSPVRRVGSPRITAPQMRSQESLRLPSVDQLASEILGLI